MGFLENLLRKIARGPAGAQKGRKPDREGKHVGPYSRVTGQRMRRRRDSG